MKPPPASGGPASRRRAAELTPTARSRLPIPSSRVVRALTLLLLVGAVGLGAGLAFGMRGRAADEPGRSPQLEALAQRAGPLVVYAEFGVDADTLWAADPDDPAQRQQLGRIDHAYGYGIFPALSPDGARVAYTVLPPLTDPDAPAELWVLAVAGGQTKRLATDVDLQAAPVWSPESDAVVARRSEWSAATETDSSELLRVDLGGRESGLVQADARLFAIDFSPDGAWLYYAELSPSGTDLARVAADGGAPETVAHLSDGFARDWDLSPDGTQLAYLAQAPADAGVAFVAQVLDLASKQAQTPLAGQPVDQFSPVWEPRGTLTVGRVDAAAGPDAPVRLGADGAALPTLAAPSGRPSGFDVPISWSPASAHLAVRSFAGASAAEPGPSRVEVVGTDGQRRALSTVSDVTIAGWLEALP